MTRFIPMAVLILVLTACQGNEHAGSDWGDELTYQKETYAFTTGHTVDFVHKVYEDEGRIAICGFLSADAGVIDTVLVEQWFAQAKLQAVTWHGSVTQISNGSFLKVQEPGSSAYDGEAVCVRSPVNWTADMKGAKLVVDGPNRVKARF